MAEPHPACPVDASAEWRLLRDGVELAAGNGLEPGLRRLWRASASDAIDDHASASGAAVSLEVGSGLGARGQVAVHVEPQGNSALLRLRDWLEGAQGQVLLARIAMVHAGLLLSSERWIQPEPPPDAESLALLTFAAIMDEPETLARALKPGH